MIGRRSLVRAATVLTAAPPLSPALSQRVAKERTLRFVPQANLSALDPIFALPGITVTHGYCVFDTLYGVDGQLRPQAQMSGGHEVSDDGRRWRFRLREGLRFHDGEPVRAIDCATSLERWSKRDAFGQMLGAAVERFDAEDDRTMQIRLIRPFPRLLEAIGKPHSAPAFIMPERFARTNPNVAISEMIGSGPWRFIADEYQSGSRAVYERFEHYVPRREPADWTSGGKRVNFERMEWIVIPDPSTAAAALQSGEVDWWEQIHPDLASFLTRRRGITVERSDPYGLIAVARFNHLHPPFDNVALRRAVLGAINQPDFMRAISGTERATWRECYSLFPCGMPGVDEAGADLMRPPRDLEVARSAVRASGYRGQRAVLLNPTDLPAVRPHGHLLAAVLRQIGINVDLQEMDWGAAVQRRNSREPIERGGWSVACTNWPSVSIANPAMNAAVRGQGTTGWPGWFESREMERLTQDWLSAAAPDDGNRIFNMIQRLSFDQVPTLPLGQFFHRHAFRNDIQGILPGSVSYFWNVRRE
jgi:peptide/nickel transport system substrate-binding protein